MGGVVQRVERCVRGGEWGGVYSCTAEIVPARGVSVPQSVSRETLSVSSETTKHTVTDIIITTVNTVNLPVTIYHKHIGRRNYIEIVVSKLSQIFSICSFIHIKKTANINIFLTQ